MGRTSLYTEEELDLLGEEEELRAKQEAGENLSDEEKSKFDKIKNLHTETPGRLREMETSKQTKEDDTEKLSLRAQKEHWRRHAIDPETGKKYSELYKELKAGAGKKEEKPDETNQLSQEEWQEQMDFIVNSEVRPTQSEILILRAIAKEKKCSLKEASETEEYETFSTAHRTKMSSEKQTPPPSEREGSILGKDMDVNKMTPEEHKKNFPAMKEKIAERLAGKKRVI